MLNGRQDRESSLLLYILFIFQGGVQEVKHKRCSNGNRYRENKGCENPEQFAPSSSRQREISFLQNNRVTKFALIHGIVDPGLLAFFLVKSERLLVGIDVLQKPIVFEAFLLLLSCHSGILCDLLCQRILP